MSWEVPGGVRASLADTPNLVKPVNFPIFMVSGEKKSTGIEPAKVVKPANVPANVLQADLHPRLRPPLIQF
jgi:hypothetical protein